MYKIFKVIYTWLLYIICVVIVTGCVPCVKPIGSEVIDTYVVTAKDVKIRAYVDCIYYPSTICYPDEDYIVTFNTGESQKFYSEKYIGDVFNKVTTRIYLRNYSDSTDSFKDTVTFEQIED